MLGAENKLSLAKQGLILVSVLIAIELLFVATLYWQIRQAEDESRKEEQLKEISTTIQAQARMYVVCKKKFGFFIIGRTEESWQRYEQQATELRTSVLGLKTALKPYPEQAALLEKIEQETNYCLDWMVKSKDEIMGMERAEAIAFVKNPKLNVGRVYNSLVDDSLALGRQMEQRLSASPEEQRKLRSMIHGLLAIGLIVNIGFAAGIQLFFMHGITSRLNVMVDNTNRLKRGDALNARVSGVDEIGVLDESFHNMSEELAEAQRTRQAFVAMVSHDLRSPLTSTHSLLEMLSAGVYGSISDDASKRVGAAERDMVRLIRMINDLLDFERMDAGGLKLEYKSAYLADVIRNSMEAVRGMAETNEVALRTKSTDLEVSADPDRLVQVLVNLISNAIKFSPKGGAVTTFAADEGDFVVVKVVDEGRGVPASMQEKIFERFKQVEIADAKEKKGTGLGLPICKAIVELHNGTIGVTSEDGKGSTFWFKIPKKPPEQATPSPS